MKRRLGFLSLLAALLLAGCQESPEKPSGEMVNLEAKPSGPRPTAAAGGGGAPNDAAKMKIQSQ